MIAPIAIIAPAVNAQTTTTAPPNDPICTDRPTKSYAPCTVDPGRWQLETDLVNVTHQNEGGVTTDLSLLTNPTLKYGVSRKMDLEVSMAPYEILRTKKRGDQSTTLGGVGDLYLSLKYAPYASVDGRFAVSILPYFKLPTARSGLGDGAVEGGAVAIFSYKITDKVVVLLEPGGAGLKNSADSGRHFATTQILNIGYSLPHSVQVSAEIWGSWDFDPAGLVRQQSADVSLSWGVTPDLQLDGGVNFGLNHQTPGLQPYVGLSRRF